MENETINCYNRGTKINKQTNLSSTLSHCLSSNTEIATYPMPQLFSILKARFRQKARKQNTETKNFLFKAHFDVTFT